MIAIIDYGMGNVKSVKNAFEYLGYEAVITGEPNQISEATHLVLPGVGAFADAIYNLKQRGLVEVLSEEAINQHKPLLGVCLGMQLLASISYEFGEYLGLGWIDAEVVKFEFSQPGLKIPHMGWNDVKVESAHPLFKGFGKEPTSFYFVHSYYLSCKEPQQVLATCNYGLGFTAAVAAGNIVGTQFHPEKSQDNGLQVLDNFAAWRP